MDRQIIIDCFGLSDEPATKSINRSDVLEWMKNEDLEAKGILYIYLTDPRHAQRIEPRLTFDQMEKFVVPYLERCLKENPASEWTLSDYEAGYEYVRWFDAAWKNLALPSEYVRGLIDNLARLYKDADVRLRRCIVDGILEHLFEDKKIASAFDSWLSDDLLAIAYAEASDWAITRRGE